MKRLPAITAFLLACACPALVEAQTPAPASPAPAAKPAPAQAPVPAPKAKLLPPVAIPPTPAPPAAPAAPAPPAPPAPPDAPIQPKQPINIRVDLTITEQGGSAPPVKKIVSTVAGDGYGGSVRETATLSGPNPVGPTMLNFDAWPTIIAPERQARGGITIAPAAQADKIRVYLNIQYSAGQDTTREAPRPRTDIRLNLTLLFENGKTLKVWEGADPIDKDRHVTVEATATVLR